MHEWALADSIVRTVIQYANGKNVGKIIIVLGELQSIDSEIVSFAIKELSRGTVVEGSSIEFIKEKAVFKCRNCGYLWRLQDIKKEINDKIKENIHFIPEVAHAFLSCPRCGSHDFDVIKGRGIYIKEIKLSR